jgi:hypothetical protein
MKPLNRLLFAGLALCALTVHAQTDELCPNVFEKAELEKESVPTGQAARRVIGAGRLYFHSAPDTQCRLADVFVLPNDRLEAYAEHGDFTEVIFWNARTRAGTAGWVVTSRTTDTEAGSRPGPPVLSSNTLR